MSGMKATSRGTSRRWVWLTVAVVAGLLLSALGGPGIAVYGGESDLATLADRRQAALEGSSERVHFCVNDASGVVMRGDAPCRAGWSSLHLGVLAPPVEVTGAALDAMVHPVSQAVTDALAAAFGLGEAGDIPASGADHVIAMLDDAGVERAVLMSVGFLGAFVADDSAVSAENDFVATEVAKSPQRLLGFCGVNPLLPGALAEIDRCLALDGMVGIKLNPGFSGMDLADSEHASALSAVFASAEQHDVPLQLHMLSPTDPAQGFGALSDAAFEHLVAIIQEHPGVRVSHSHCGGVIDEHPAEQWLQRMRPAPGTTFLDLSHCLEHFEDAPLSKRELIVWRLRQWGIEQLLLSSDHVRMLGFQTTADALGTLAKYPFTQEEIDTITGNDGSAWLHGE